MSIKDLIAVMPPPSCPIEPGSPDRWPEVEAEFDIVFPADYKEYITTYGTGIVGGYIYPFNPFVSVSWVSFREQRQRWSDIYRLFKERHGPASFPYPLYPEKEGLIPWARTDQEETLFWYPNSSPDHWSIVMAEEPGRDRYEEYAETMTSLLYKWLTEELTPSLFKYAPMETPGHGFFKPDI